MRGKVLGHEQEDVLELCLMLLADGLCSMPGAVVAIRVTEKVEQLVVSLKTSYVNEEWNRQQQSSCLQIMPDVSLHGWLKDGCQMSTFFNYLFQSEEELKKHGKKRESFKICSNCLQ